MELKFIEHTDLHNFSRLLIVPYGIEISESERFFKSSILLIVPYGIEIMVS